MQQLRPLECSAECEADVAAGRLSLVSPVGRALLGHRAGETVVVAVPDGVRPLRIVPLA